MFTRAVTFTGATDIEGGVKFVREKVAPAVREHAGYRGLLASADRAAGVLGVLSLWETEADLDASEQAMVPVRKEHQRLISAEVTVETFEEVLWEVAAPPGVGSSLLLRRISMDPAQVEDNLEFFRRQVLPQIKAEPGFRAVRQMVNRRTGRGMVGTVWADRASMQAAAEAAEARGAQAAQREVSVGEQSQREIVFGDFPS